VDFTVVDYVLYAVALLLLVSLALFVKAVFFDKRPQKTGLIVTVITLPLYLIYYNDRWPFGEKVQGKWVANLQLRDRVLPDINGADLNFASHVVPAAIIAGVLLIHMTVLQRVAVKERLQRVHNPVANFFASTTAATLVGGILVSMFHWGWVGAVIVGAVFALVYLGAIALLAALVEVVVEVCKLFVVWLKRKVFAIATAIARASSWISSLSGRLGLNSLSDRIREDTLQQESIFNQEQEKQDKELYEAFLRDRARRRRMLQGGALPPEPTEGDSSAPEPATAPAATPDATQPVPAAEAV
jgi:hypothetical protein